MSARTASPLTPPRSAFQERHLIRCTDVEKINHTYDHQERHGPDRGGGRGSQQKKHGDCRSDIIGIPEVSGEKTTVIEPHPDHAFPTAGRLRRLRRWGGGGGGGREAGDDSRGMQGPGKDAVTKDSLAQTSTRVLCVVNSASVPHRGEFLPVVSPLKKVGEPCIEIDY